MPSQASGAATPETRGSKTSWLLPAGTFLAGCALGAVVMGVGDSGTEDVPSPSTAAATDGEQEASGDGAAGDASADDGGAGLYVRVPESCVRTADGATSLVEHVDRLVAAVADLQPEPLRQTVDDVQQVREGVREVADQCRAAAAERLQDAAGAEGGDAAPTTPGS